MSKNAYTRAKKRELEFQKRVEQALGGRVEPAGLSEEVNAAKRFYDLYTRWVDRDTDADNFELHLELLRLCDRWGWDVPESLK